MRHLAKPLELLLVYAQLAKDSVKERRTDLSSAVNRDCGCAPVCVFPALMTSGLTSLSKSELTSDAPEFLCSRARHSRSRSCRPAAADASPGIHPISTEIRPRAPQGLLPGWASVRGILELRGFPPPIPQVGCDTEPPCNLQSPPTSIVSPGLSAGESALVHHRHSGRNVTIRHGFAQLRTEGNHACPNRP
jgi:hypothetical protein